ncbi:hypothetical protein CGCSCA1_v000675 [Colletotrichum siamense]|nr:hypothetical protein CGCSCA1_v000675 [Colletotrichum siamense]
MIFELFFALAQILVLAEASRASFVTLSDFSITTPTIITTTKAGSNGQEIVPVILVKPKKKNPTDPDPIPVPVVCFGCFPGIQFPPKIKVTLKLPEICIQILWFKIENCPSGEDKKGGGGDGGDGNDDDKPNDEPDDPESTQKSTEKTSSTSSSSSSSSCTVTATATHQTVYCSVTQGVRGDSTSLLTTAQTTCLSSTYTTITGCSVTNTATTVTTTVASTQIPFYPPCSPHVCGGGVCQSTPNRALSRDMEKRGNPAQGEWVDPDDYPNGYAEFMPAQLREARSRPGGEGFAPKLLKQGPGPARGPYPIFNDTDEGEEAAREYYYSELPVSTEFLIFEDEVQSLAIDRMVGCDAIILVSRLGAFVCHFYQGSWDSDRHMDDLMRFCYYGRPENDPMREWAQYGIDNVRDHPEEGKRGIILGDQDSDAEEDDFEDIVAFIITPRVRPNIWIIDRDGPRVIPDEEILAPDVMAGRLRYAPDRVNRVKLILTGIFLDIPIKTIDYPPAMLPYAEWSRLEALDDTFAFVEGLQDSIVDTPRGVPAPSKFKTSLLMTSVSTARTVDRLPATQAPIKPEPFSVRIHYKEWTSGWGGAISTQGVWEMFVAAVRAEVDLCETEDVGHEFQSYFRPSEWFDDKRPPSFEADQAIFGRKNCRYKEGGKSVPGRFSCDGVDEFDCRLSDRPKVECKEAFDIKVFYGMVECAFPVQ